MIKKAVVLCAGRGTRLRPLTFARPKPLLPIAGKPMLGWILEAVSACGLSDVCIVTGNNGHLIRDYADTGQQWELNISYAHQKKPRGIADALAAARDQLGNQPFIAYLGDNLVEGGITEFVNGASELSADGALALKPVDNPRRFGVAQVDNGRVIGLDEKPQHPAGNLAVVGIYALTPQIFDVIDNMEPSDRGEFEITDAIAGLIENGADIRFTRIDKRWDDVGIPAALLSANRHRLTVDTEPAIRGKLKNCQVEGNVFVGAEAQVSDSRLVGPLKIDTGCNVRQAIIGPGVYLGPNCHLTNISMENSIVIGDAHIGDIQPGLVDSIVGKGAVIEGIGTSCDGNISLCVADAARVQTIEAD